jgi:TonB-linked SusC/RagA family outer membrane protein
MKNKLLRQLIMLSKLTFYGIFLQCLFYGLMIAADSDAQRIRTVNDVYVRVETSESEISEIFQLIEANSEFQFTYYVGDFDPKQIIRVDRSKQSVKDLLLLISKEAHLAFRQVNNNINVQRSEKSIAEETIPIIIQGITITGRVVSQEDDSGLPGVNVIIKGTSQGTVTDVEGNYSLEVPGTESTLVFSSVGYIQEEVTVGNRTVIDMVLAPDITSLEEIVVVGYGVQKRANVTGAISGIKSEAIQERAIATVEEAFAGQIAGVQAQQTSGAPGSQLNIRIRGANTITRSSEPLYVIDGLLVDNLQDINPNDIESIEVLKDASAAAIYGARGAGGVVLISTKTGQKGKPVFDFNMFYGLQEPERYIEMMNRDEFIDYSFYWMTERIKELGLDPNTPNLDRPANRQLPQEWLDNPEAQPDTDWQKLVTQTAPIQNYQLTVSGGSEIGTYLISGNYFDQKGILVNTNYKRYSFRANTELNISDRVKVGLNLNPTFSSSSNPDSEGKESAYNRAIDYPPPIPADMGTEKTGYLFYIQPNPVEILKQTTETNLRSRILANIYLDYEFLEGFSFRSRFGIDSRNDKYTYFRPSNVNRGRPPEGRERDQDWMNWNIDNTLNYRTTINSDHNLDILVGQSAQEDNYYNLEARATGYPNEKIFTMNVASEPTRARSNRSSTSILSYFGRVQYNFKEKYILSASVRRDGSSRFGADTKWGTFPALSLGWRMDQESFIQSVPWISLLKIRVAIGETGNFNIPAYGSIGLLGEDNYSLNGQIRNGLRPRTIENPTLSWETTTTRDIGLELSLFDDRIQFSADYYINSTSDLLLDVPVSGITGFTSALQNIGEVENRGWEIEVTSYNLSKSALQWNTNFNVSRNKNEVLALGPEGTPIIANSWGGSTHITQIGSPIGSYFMYKRIGLLTQEDIDNGVAIMPGQVAGNVRVQDTNGDGVIDQNDRTIVGDNYPDFLLGMNNSLSYRNFTFNLLLQAATGFEVFHFGARHYDSGNGSRNQMTRWATGYRSESDPGDGNAPFPRGENPSHNTDWLFDGSFLRIRNISLGYNFSTELMQKLGLRSARIYLMADNLVTWTDYPGSTPESNSQGNNTTAPGRDYSTYPTSRRYSLGLNVQF